MYLKGQEQNRVKWTDTRRGGEKNIDSGLWQVTLIQVFADSLINIYGCDLDVYFGK